MADTYPAEKQELPAPVQQRAPHRCPNFFRLVLRFVLTFFMTVFLIDLFQGMVISEVGSPSTRAVSHCVNRYKHGRHGKHGHHIPDVSKWHEVFDPVPRFELEPEQASGLTIKGGKTFGKVVFETSKLSDKVIIELDIRTKKASKESQVSLVNDNGYITVDAGNDKKTYASAKIQIPSNIIGTFGLPKFEVDAPRHMVDFSSLPESLEIGEFTVRVAKGFVKAGKVHTNSTQISIASGALRGSLVGAAYNTNIDVASGNVTVDVEGISSGKQGELTIHLGNGALSGHFAVYNSTSLDVARGSIYANINFEEAGEGNRGSLSTKVASGNARVYVDDIAEGRQFDASHLTIAGDQLITYPESFEGTVDARGLIGDIKLAGKDLTVEKALGGQTGIKGDPGHANISIKAAKGSIDFLVADE